MDMNETNENLEDDSDESFIREYWSLVVLIIGFVIYVIISLYVLFNPSQLVREIWFEFKDYQSSLLTILPIVIAATFLFHIFYLGKLHDYHRDFIKQYGVFTEMKLLIERKYSSAEIKQHDELIEAMNNDSEYYEDTNDFFKSHPKDLFLSLGGTIVLLALSYVFMLKENMNTNEMLFTVISIIFGFCLIPIAILLSEKSILRHDQELKDITQDIAYLKAYSN